MNAVGNDVGTEPVVGKHLGDDAGIAMIERTHGIECVSRMTRPCLDCTLGDRQLGIGVSYAHADISARRFGNHFHRSRNLRRDGHHAHVAPCGLP